MVQYLGKYSPWHTGADTEQTGKQSYCQEEGEEVGDGRAEGSSAIGDRGQAAVLLMPDDGTHVLIFESSQTEGSYVRGLL